MITIVDPIKPYVQEFCNPLWNYFPEIAMLFNALNGKEYREQTIPLTCVCKNPVIALKYFTIDNSIFENSRVNDAYTGYKAYGVVPICILSNRIEKYKSLIPKESPSPFFVLDHEYWKKQYGKKLHNISQIGKLLMGSGFPKGSTGSDGRCEVTKAKFRLSNDDYLMVAFWEWYSK